MCLGDSNVNIKMTEYNNIALRLVFILSRFYKRLNIPRLCQGLYRLTGFVSVWIGWPCVCVSVYLQLRWALKLAALGLKRDRLSAYVMEGTFIASLPPFCCCCWALLACRLRATHSCYCFKTLWLSISAFWI